jgi:CBS domain containing-hemolysin-like protein
VKIHHAEDAGSLLADEVNIVNSVLGLQEKSVCDVMTPIERVYTLREDCILDEATTDEVSLVN